MFEYLNKIKNMDVRNLFTITMYHGTLKKNNTSKLKKITNNTIKFNDTNVNILYVNIDHFVKVHKFLTSKDFYFEIRITYEYFETLFKENKKDMILYMFSNDIRVNNNYCYGIFFRECFSTSCKYADLDVIMQVCDFFYYIKIRESDIDDLIDVLCEREDIQIIDRMFDYWKIPIKTLNKKLCKAAHVGNLSILKLFIQKGANLFLNKKKILEISMLNNYIDIFNYIFCPSIDKIYIKDYIVDKCITANNTEIIQMLLSKVSYSKEWMRSCFDKHKKWFANNHCDMDIVKLFTESGFLTKKQINGFTRR